MGRGTDEKDGKDGKDGSSASFVAAAAGAFMMAGAHSVVRNDNSPVIAVNGRSTEPNQRETT